MPEATCSTCKDRSTCKAICKEVEKILSRRDIEGYSKRQKQRKEVLFPTAKLEDVANSRAFQIKYGKGYFKGRRGQEGGD
jgi:hypothetical protein